MNRIFLIALMLSASCLSANADHGSTLQSILVSGSILDRPEAMRNLDEVLRTSSDIPPGLHAELLEEKLAEFRNYISDMKVILKKDQIMLQFNTFEIDIDSVINGSTEVEAKLSQVIDTSLKAIMDKLDANIRTIAYRKMLQKIHPLVSSATGEKFEEVPDDAHLRQSIAMCVSKWISFYIENGKLRLKEDVELRQMLFINHLNQQIDDQIRGPMLNLLNSIDAELTRTISHIDQSLVSANIGLSIASTSSPAYGGGFMVSVNSRDSNAISLFLSGILSDDTLKVRYDTLSTPEGNSDSLVARDVLLANRAAFGIRIENTMGFLPKVLCKTLGTRRVKYLKRRLPKSLEAKNFTTDILASKWINQGSQNLYELGFGLNWSKTNNNMEGRSHSLGIAWFGRANINKLLNSSTWHSTNIYAIQYSNRTLNVLVGLADRRSSPDKKRTIVAQVGHTFNRFLF